ncbi:hypothetical protein N403_05670 [Helicobacter pylori FD430]|nr:hypothetical protein N402_05225 [Helicobacter pylori FD423]EQL50319.1 hypothetical protein N403_05670 [Helicobacter pylori FD430]EQL72866.1 hypothetical protein N409_00320 [Helicobacter pylori FD719]
MAQQTHEKKDKLEKKMNSKTNKLIEKEFFLKNFSKENVLKFSI